MRALSIAQVAGYLYSGLVLGVGIPKLNIYMTNKSEAKRKARLAAEKAKQAPDAQKVTPNKQAEALKQPQLDANEQYKAMIKPESKTFLGK